MTRGCYFGPGRSRKKSSALSFRHDDAWPCSLIRNTRCARSRDRASLLHVHFSWKKFLCWPGFLVPKRGKNIMRGVGLQYLMHVFAFEIPSSNVFQKLGGSVLGFSQWNKFISRLCALFTSIVGWCRCKYTVCEKCSRRLCWIGTQVLFGGF